MRISIIVPVYNVEKYIEDCIKSILAQTFDDFELILIDDGSTDSSYSICYTYSKSNKKIKLLKKENGGVSSARNLGLEQATGEYIAFIDSDDYVAPNYLENLISSIEPKTEFVFSGLRYFAFGKEQDNVHLEHYSWNLMQEHDFLNFLQQPLQTSPCAKLYLHSVIKDNNLRFDKSLSYAEDKDFNLKFFRHISNAVSISYSGYFYRQDVEGSLTKKKHEKVFQYKCLHWEMKREICLKRHFNSVKVHTSLVNELFNIVNDEIVSKAQNSSSLFVINKEDMDFVDFNYLKKWSNKIQAPLWKKSLILNKIYILIVFIYKIYLYGQKKG